MAAPSCSPIINLLLRILTITFLLVSLIVLVTISATVPLSDTEEVKAHAMDILAYRYMLSTIVIGMAYNLLQTAFSIYHISTGNRLINNNGFLLFDFYGDKVMSYILATGASAAFGVTIDLKKAVSEPNADKFFSKANASASILLIGFLCSAISSVFSSFSLPKND